MRQGIIKTFSIVGLLLCFAIQTYAQNVGINTTTPQSTLDIKTSGLTTAEGVIAPRLTRQQLISKDAVYGSNQTNTLIYVTDLSGTVTTKTQAITAPGYYYFDGTAWQSPVIEPWNKVNTLLKASLNNDSVYQQAKVVVRGNTIGTVNGAPAALTVYTNDASFNDIRVGKGNANSARCTALGENALLFSAAQPGNNDLTAIGYNYNSNYTAARNTTVGYQNYGNNVSDLVTLSSRYAFYSPSSTSVLIGAPSASNPGANNVLIGQISPNSCVNNVLIGGYMNLNPTYYSVLVGDSISGNSTSNAVFVGAKISTNYAEKSTIIGTNNHTNYTTYLILGNNTSYPYEGSNGVVLGNQYITSIRAAVTSITLLSDSRVKKNIKNNVPGLRFISKLNPVTYKLDILEVSNSETSKSIRSAGDIVHSGFIAQDVEKVINEIGYDFDGIYIPKNDKDRYSLNYSSFVVPMVKAVQEQQATIKEEQTTLSQLQKKLQEQNDRLKAVSLKLDALEK